MSFINSLWKWSGRIVSKSLYLREVACCYNRLWEFSVTKPVYYKDVFVNSFCSSTFRSANSLVVEPFLRPVTLLKKKLAQVFSSEFCGISKNTFFTENCWATSSVSFDLLSKQLLNLELIPSSQRQNDNGDVYSFWSLGDIDSLIIKFVVCIALMLFLPMCI